MKQKISNMLQSIGYGVQAEHAGEIMSLRRKSDFLSNHKKTPPTPARPEQQPDKDNPVAFHVVPSLVVHK